MRVQNLKIVLGPKLAALGPKLAALGSQLGALGSKLVALVRNLAQVGRFGVQVGRAGAKFGPSWSLLGRFWLLTRVDFGASALLLRSSESTRSQKSRSVKTPPKPFVFACFSFFRIYAHETHIEEKRFRKRFLSESRDRSAAKGTFFELGGLQMVSKSSLGRLGRPLGANLGALEGFLGRS